MKASLIIISVCLASGVSLEAQESVKSELSPVLTSNAKPSDLVPESAQLTPKTTPNVILRTGIVSNETSALVIGGLPKYSPPKPEVKEKTLAEEFPDLRDVDKPQNKIIRLPKYMVKASRSPVLTDKAIMSEAQKIALTYRKYAGLGISPLNDEVAKQFYREDLRLQNIADLNELAGAMKSGGDASESEYIKRQSNETYMRGNEWGGVKVNWGGTVPPPSN